MRYAQGIGGAPTVFAILCSEFPAVPSCGALGAGRGAVDGASRAAEAEYHPPGLLALALSGCAQVGAQVPTSGQVRVLTTAVVATPTLGPTSGPMFYVPLIVQGIPEPTAATRRLGDPPRQPRRSRSQCWWHSIASQSPSTDGFTLDVEGEVRTTAGCSAGGAGVGGRAQTGRVVRAWSPRPAGQDRGGASAREAWPFSAPSAHLRGGDGPPGDGGRADRPGTAPVSDRGRGRG